MNLATANDNQRIFKVYTTIYHTRSLSLSLGLSFLQAPTILLAIDVMSHKIVSKKVRFATQWTLDTGPHEIHTEILWIQTWCHWIRLTFDWNSSNRPDTWIRTNWITANRLLGGGGARCGARGDAHFLRDPLCNWAMRIMRFVCKRSVQIVYQGQWLNDDLQFTQEKTRRCLLSLKWLIIMIM